MVGPRRVKGAWSARTEGGRRATGVGADSAAVGSGALAPGQRWSASRKRDVVLRLLRGESLDAVSREVGMEVYRLEAWKARALAGLEPGLKAQAGEPLATERDTATGHIGELSMEHELLRAGVGPRPAGLSPRAGRCRARHLTPGNTFIYNGVAAITGSSLPPAIPRAARPEAPRRASRRPPCRVRRR